MTNPTKTSLNLRAAIAADAYTDVNAGTVAPLEAARRASARSGNASMAANFWEIGRQPTDAAPGGERRAAHGTAPAKRLGADRVVNLGRGSCERDQAQMWAVHPAMLASKILQTASAKSRPCQPLRTRAQMGADVMAIEKEAAAPLVGQLAGGSPT